jgi:uncharacterized protein with NRDE domain
MCVAAVAWHAHPDWRLVAIGNRDEFHDRPAAQLARWNEARSLIAGRDLRSGGTWLGLSEQGRFVLVTNRRGFGDPDPALASRGKLVMDVLSGSGQYADPRVDQLGDFNPFNLIAIAYGQAHFLSNRPEPVHSALLHGIYGLSNGTLDEPWPKTLYLKAALLDWLNNNGGDTGQLFAALASETRGDVGLNPRQPSEITAEARDTAPFIRNPVYGTRCSTVVMIDREGAGLIAERRFDAAGQITGETGLRFRWP